MAAEGGAVPVPVALFDDRAGQLAGGRRIQPDVEEAGSGDLDRPDTGRVAQPVRDDRRQLAGRPGDRLRQLERQRRGVVAVFRAAGALHARRTR